MSTRKLAWCAELALVLVGSASALAQQPPSAKPSQDEALIRQLQDSDPALVRQAAEALQNQQLGTPDEKTVLADAVKSALSSTRDAAAEVALRLALGKLAAAGVADAAEWGFESMSVTHRPTTPPEVFAAHVRALEMVPGAAQELMLGNLDVALNFPEADPKERQRLKEFVTLTAEGMKTRELAAFLDALLSGEGDLLAKIEAPLEARLIACYQNIKSDPPLKVDVLVEWLERHPAGAPEVDLVGLETVFLVGTTQPAAATKLADRLLKNPQFALASAKRLLDGHPNPALRPHLIAALRQHVAPGKNSESARVLQQLEQTRD